MHVFKTIFSKQLFTEINTCIHDIYTCMRTYIFTYLFTYTFVFTN